MEEEEKVFQLWSCPPDPEMVKPVPLAGKPSIRDVRARPLTVSWPVNLIKVGTINLQRGTCPSIRIHIPVLISQHNFGNVLVRSIRINRRIGGAII